MSDIALDTSTHDIDPTRSTLTDEATTEATGQRLSIILLLFRGESRVFPNDGVDWYRYILGQKFLRVSSLNAAFVPVIRETEGVAEIMEPLTYELVNATRRLNASAKVMTDLGEELTVEV